MFDVTAAFAAASCQDQWPRHPDERPAAQLGRRQPVPIIEKSCALPSASPSARRRKAAAGFTLIEMLIAVSIAGVLSSIAYPSFESQVQRARRADVLVSMMAVQLAEERWRSNSASYGDLAQIGVSPVSTAGHYRLQITQPGTDGYRILATATGAQARDTACSHLSLSVDGGNVTTASGPDASTANPAASNRKCWNL